jgi:hypothetical protein
MRALVLLFLVSCAYGVDDPIPLPPEVFAPKTYVPAPKPRRVECEVVRVDKTNSGCTIYTLSCEGELNFAVICDTKPIGVITDPPRPINYIKGQ